MICKGLVPLLEKKLPGMMVKKLPKHFLLIMKNYFALVGCYR